MTGRTQLRTARAHSSAGSKRVGAPGEGGFTLIELLVVLVVIPLIIGGIAEALIVSFDNQSANSNRVSDSVNAQLTSDYLVRDVQGASYITTLDNSSSGVYAANSPQVCKPTSAGSLLVALFHPSYAGAPALDIAYWRDGTGPSTEIDRYSCTLTGAPNFTSPSTSAIKTAVATPPPGISTGTPLETITTTTDITPSQFSGAAAFGWTPAAALALTDSNISPLSSASTIDVGSPLGFTTGTNASGVCAPSPTVTSASGCSGGVLTIATTEGMEQVECTGFTLTPPSFTGCSGGGAGAVVDNSPITQSNMSGVQLGITQPASSYHYSLLGTPRPGSPESEPPGSGGPTLLTLGGSGINPIHGGGSGQCPDAARANICIGNGGVIVDAGGTVFCTGAGPHSYIHFEAGTGYIDTVAPGSSSSCNTVQAGPTSGIPDPLRNSLPNNGCITKDLVTALPMGKVVGAISYPGLYAAGNQPSGKLEPGLYVVESGIGTITGMVTPSSGDQYYQVPFASGAGNYDPTAGALFYVPGPGPYLPAQGCFTSSASTGLAGSLNGLVPLDANQSASYFGGDPALGAVWLWQDPTIPIPSSCSPATTPGCISITGTTAEGLIYAPGATFSLGGSSSIATGAMIVAGLSLSGTDTVILSWP